MNTDYTDPKLTKTQKEMLELFYTTQINNYKVIYNTKNAKGYAAHTVLVTPTNGETFEVDSKTFFQLRNKWLINDDGQISGEEFSNIGTIVCEKLFGKIEQSVIETVQPIVETIQPTVETVVNETATLTQLFTAQELYILTEGLSKFNSITDNVSLEASGLAHNLRNKFNDAIKALLDTNIREELGFKCICHNLEFSDCPKLAARKVA